MFFLNFAIAQIGAAQEQGQNQQNQNQNQNQQSQVDTTLTVNGNVRIDATDVERDLGQATLSPGYSLCLSDAKSNNKLLSACLDEELGIWQQDMNIAFNLVAATLPFEQMKLLRDSQRLWVEAQDRLCVETGLVDAEPFTRFHIPTCKLKLTFQRAIGLEALLQDEDRDFERDLSSLDDSLNAE
ncbi:MAG: lysozyme inhibitor LprI family protein [Alphaproteobacteria bacterium]